MLDRIKAIASNIANYEFDLPKVFRSFSRNTRPLVGLSALEEIITGYEHTTPPILNVSYSVNTDVYSESFDEVPKSFVFEKSNGVKNTKYGPIIGCVVEIKCRFNYAAMCSGFSLSFGDKVFVLGIECNGYSRSIFETTSILRTAIPDVTTNYVSVIIVIPGVNLFCGGHGLFIEEFICYSSSAASYYSVGDTVVLTYDKPILATETLHYVSKEHDTSVFREVGGTTIGYEDSDPTRIVCILDSMNLRSNHNEITYVMSHPYSTYPLPFPKTDIFSDQLTINNVLNGNKFFKNDNYFLVNERNDSFLAEGDVEVSEHTVGVTEVFNVKAPSYPSYFSIQGVGEEESGSMRQGNWYVIGDPLLKFENRSQTIGHLKSIESRYVDSIKLDLKSLLVDNMGVRVFCYTNKLEFIGCVTNGTFIKSIQREVKGFVLAPIYEAEERFKNTRKSFTFAAQSDGYLEVNSKSGVVYQSGFRGNSCEYLSFVKVFDSGFLEVSEEDTRISARAKEAIGNRITIDGTEYDLKTKVLYFYPMANFKGYLNFNTTTGEFPTTVRVLKDGVGVPNMSFVDAQVVKSNQGTYSVVEKGGRIIDFGKDGVGYEFESGHHYWIIGEYLDGDVEIELQEKIEASTEGTRSVRNLLDDQGLSVPVESVRIPFIAGDIFNVLGFDLGGLSITYGRKLVARLVNFTEFYGTPSSHLLRKVSKLSNYMKYSYYIVFGKGDTTRVRLDNIPNVENPSESSVYFLDALTGFDIDNFEFDPVTQEFVFHGVEHVIILDFREGSATRDNTKTVITESITSKNKKLTLSKFPLEINSVVSNQSVDSPIVTYEVDGKVLTVLSDGVFLVSYVPNITEVEIDSALNLKTSYVTYWKGDLNA